MITASFSDVKIEVTLKKMLSYDFSKQMRKTAALLLFFAFFCSCSLFKARIPPYPSGIIFPLARDAELAYEGDIIARIQKSENRLYLSTRQGKIYCIDGQKREILWSYDAPDSLTSAPFLGKDSIYVTGEQDSLYCLSTAGQLRWEKAFTSQITSELLADNNRIFLGTGDGECFCLSSEDGQEIWRYQADGEIRSNPVIWNNLVLFGCDDHHLYFLSQEGRLVRKFDTGGKLKATLLVDDDYLYFGTEDRYLHCVDLSRNKTKWKIRTGAETYIPPAIDNDRVFFLCWNCVLYCLNKKSGTILWWNSVPSRSYYRLEVIDDKIVASSLSSTVVCFGLYKGEKQGAFDASQEIKSNPIWFEPYLLVNVYDRDSNAGKLVFLKKEVKATILPSKGSPRKANEEVVFTANATGFYMPNYKFFLTRLRKFRLYPDLLVFSRDEERNVVQESSEANSWSWFPEQEGYYFIGVEIVDEREKAETEIPFVINRAEAKVTLSSSLESPQEIDKEIVFRAKSEGINNPQFEFRLGTLIKLKVLTDFFLFFKEEKVVQELSEKDTWTWNPEKDGIYSVRVIVVGTEQGVDSEMTFMIRKKKNELRKGE
jgi:outer membrane protein assembly factor BamB